MALTPELGRGQGHEFKLALARGLDEVALAIAADFDDELGRKPVARSQRVELGGESCIAFGLGGTAPVRRLTTGPSGL